MASVVSKKLEEARSLAGAGPHLSDVKSLEPKQTDLIAFAKTAAGAAGNTTVTIEHSPDSVNWFTLASIPVIAGVGANKVDITTPAFANIRSSSVLTGTADVTVEVYYDRQ